MKDGNLIVRSGKNCPPGLVVLFGDMLTDIAQRVYGGSLAEVPGFLEAPGGAPANVAIAVARLGGKAAYVGKLGDDKLGHRLAGILRENDVVDEGIYFDNGASTAHALVNPSADGLNFALIRSAKVFHYGSINLIEDPCRTAHLKAMKVAKDAGLLLSYDPNLQLPLWSSQENAREQIKSIWDKADLIKVSDVEFEFLTGSNKINYESAMSLVHPNLKLLIVTLEDLGCKYYTKNFHGEVEAFLVDSVDTTGAGDSFVGALLFKIVDDQSILEDEPRLRAVLKFANACGAITTTRKGAVSALPTESDASTLIRGA